MSDQLRILEGQHSDLRQALQRENTRREIHNNWLNKPETQIILALQEKLQTPETEARLAELQQNPEAIAPPDVANEPELMMPSASLDLTL